MYTVLIDGQRHSIDAENINITDGNMYFFEDKESTKVKAIVPAGKWCLIECSEGKAMQVQQQENRFKEAEKEILEEVAEELEKKDD